MNLRRAAVCVTLLLCSLATSASGSAFSASFEEYDPGEALGVKGARGGAWSVGGAAATNVTVAARAAMDYEGVVTFAAEASCTGNVERVHVSSFVESLDKMDIAAEGGAAGIMAVLHDDGVPGYFVWGSGKWQRVVAEGASPVEGAWFDACVELKSVAGVRLVSYLVKCGGDYVRCRTREGDRTWFLAGECAERREVEFSGYGKFAELDGDGVAEPEPPVYRWTGGAAGDWDDPSCWEKDGVSGAGVPGTGSFAFVTNAVEMTRGEERASLTSLVVSDGTNLVGGGVKTSIELKVERARVGQAMEPSVGRFFGVEPDYTFLWRRGPWNKAWEGGAVGRTRAYAPTQADYGKWLRLVVSNATEEVFANEVFFSTLPVCYLATDDGGAPTAAKEVHEGTLFVQGNDEFKKQYDGRLEFRVRGNSSASHPKKSYKLKLDEKTKMFSLGEKKDRHWAMIASYNDMSLLRNKMAGDFANEIGSMGMKSTWADCILNGEYMGTYLFIESIRISSGRVNVFDWEDAAADFGASEEDFSAIDALLAQDPDSVDITGGYLFEFDVTYDEPSKFKIYSGKLEVPVMFHKPEYLCTSARMMEWCMGFMQNYWDACTSATHLSGEGRHWSEYSDVDSMVNYWLVNELHGNLDAYQKSRYAYIDRGGKLTWGPVWDFDYASASVAIPTAQQPDVWFCSNDDWSKSENAWNTSSWRNFTQSCVYKEWASDPYFCMKAWERYWEIRGKYVELSADGGAVANAAARLKGALAVNDARWSRGRGHFADTEIYWDFLRRRVAWLDAQFKDVPTLTASLKSSGQTVPYVADGVAIEPAADGARRIVSAAVRSAVQVDVFVNGRLLGRYQVAGGAIGEVPVPRGMLEREGRFNCVAFVAYGRSGAIVARNYCLFPTVPDRGTRIFIR